MAKEFEGQFEYLGENMEKCKTFSVLTEKEVTKIDTGGNENVVNISYKIKFIDTARFMASSLSNFVDNLPEGIHKAKYKDCYCFREYESVKNNLMKYKCLSCNRDDLNKLNEKLKSNLRTHLSFLIMILINLFWY